MPRPDKGRILESTVWTWKINPSTQKLERVKLANGEDWACDGQKIYNVNNDQKTVEETTLPPELARPGDYPGATAVRFRHQGRQAPAALLSTTDHAEGG